MTGNYHSSKDAYDLVLDAIEQGVFKPGDRMVEVEMAERFGVSRTPIREAFQRLETQGMLARDGRSLFVAALDHDQLGELFVVRAELEGLATRLAAQHAGPEEIRVLHEMIARDRKLIGSPDKLSRANKRFHHQLHLASHNRFLIQQLGMVHRSMALLTTTSFARAGRSEVALDEHEAIVRAIEARDGVLADDVTRAHISAAYETRLKLEAGDE